MPTRDMHAFIHHGQNQRIYQGDNQTDADGNPAGGNFSGPGISITWQDGPVSPGNPAHGATLEDAIAALIYRAGFFEGEFGGDGKFACPENQDTLFHLRQAHRYQLLRTERRNAQGVEGSHLRHKSEDAAP